MRDRRQRYLLCVALVWPALTTITACGPGLETTDTLCREVVCDEPPPAQCSAEGVLRTFSPTGRCDQRDGRCDYTHVDEICDGGCHDTTRCRRPGDMLWSSTSYPAFRDPDRDPTDVESPTFVALSVAPAGETVYLTSRNGWLHAVDGKGQERWRFDAFSEEALPAGMTGRNMAAPVVAEDGSLYLAVSARVPDASRGLVLQALAPDGSMRWAWAEPEVLHRAEARSPALSPDGETIYCVDEARLVAISATGQKRWQATLDNPRGEGFFNSNTAPLVDPQGNIFLQASFEVPLFRGWHYRYLISAAGALRWSLEQYDQSMSVAPPAIGSDGTIFFYRQLVLSAIRELDGREKTSWQFPAGSEQSLTRFSNIVIDEEGDIWFYARMIVDGSAADGHIYALSPTGEIRRRLPFGEYRDVSLLLTADETLLVVANGDDSPLHLITSLKRDGTPRWETRIFEGEVTPQNSSQGVFLPVISPAGTIYAYSSRLGLVAVLGEKPLAKSPWPAPRADSQNTARTAEPTP